MNRNALFRAFTVRLSMGVPSQAALSSVPGNRRATFRKACMGPLAESGVSGNELVKTRPRPATPRQGWREEERIVNARRQATGPLTQASAPVGRSAEMGRWIGERI